ncbi:hypothetical protein G432_05140 [Sphingomonas sp. MM-1]|uniref:hypothetical protein n=1 Tax=Sphingomonas sp. MM-1 TaxID=745310 RepID=UPI0002C073D6|nr:hypothetical protein [Sphingomonas sp. MM-1]AGH48755.1 hypothetical protein G432_05140 [Sphingomonas sp. MM-1]
MAMVSVTNDLTVNTAYVASVSWDRGDTYTTLVITMADGTAHRVKHQGGPYGVDAYDAERRLLAAAER